MLEGIYIHFKMYLIRNKKINIHARYKYTFFRYVPTNRLVGFMSFVGSVDIFLYLNS